MIATNALDLPLFTMWGFNGEKKKGGGGDPVTAMAACVVRVHGGDRRESGNMGKDNKKKIINKVKWNAFDHDCNGFYNLLVAAKFNFRQKIIINVSKSN